ncbi:MAG TPA: hypothetical protein VM097_12275 [Mycobacteriales bacterium]|nr:hypothetical protein [Mycobacteriales bacterium]
MRGTKAFVQARGHGRAWAGEPGYQVLADDLLSEADRLGATRAVGVSLGAGALLRLLSQHPTRFDRVVLLLPVALDIAGLPAVRRGGALAGALRARDRAAVERLVRSELPDTGSGLGDYVAARTELLLAADVLPLLDALTREAPVADRASLAAVTAEVLVLGQEGDDVHPAAVAREVAAAMPSARLVAFARPSPLVHERFRLRSLITGHLDGPTG